MSARSSRLRAIKAVHTLVWAVLAGTVIAIPIASFRGDLRIAAGLAAVIALEGAVLALNRGRCPLTSLAARYTDDRRDNFDIYLPEWLARYNKLIFGTIYALGVSYALAHWLLAQR